MGRRSHGLRRSAKSKIPTLGYGVNTMGDVLLALWGTVIVMRLAG